MIKTTEMLRNELNEYRNPNAKIKRMVEAGSLIPIIRGLYETDSSIPGHCLAASIYGPSYLSFEFALGHYDLIPETVYHFTCATFGKKKIKRYTTPFGVFSYRDIPGSAYPMEVSIHVENGYAYQMATAEKAICDMLYKIAPLKNIKGLKSYLFEDLRIEREAFDKLDMHKLQSLCGLYKTQNHKLLRSLAKREE